MENKNQKLTLDISSRSSEKYKNLKEFDVRLEVDGELRDFTVEMYKVFSPISIKECVKEYIRNLDKARRKSEEGFKDIQVPYLIFLMVKHFTTLGEQISDEFEDHLVHLKNMINNTSLYQIIMHFEEDEIEKIKEELEIVLRTFNDNFGILEEIKQSLKGKIKNKELLE